MLKLYNFFIYIYNITSNHCNETDPQITIILLLLLPKEKFFGAGVAIMSA